MAFQIASGIVLDEMYVIPCRRGSLLSQESISGRVVSTLLMAIRETCLAGCYTQIWTVFCEGQELKMQHLTNLVTFAVTGLACNRFRIPTSLEVWMRDGCGLPESVVSFFGFTI